MPEETPPEVLHPPMEIVAIYISPGHNFFGHHGRPADVHPTIARDEVECVAGKGLRGDRFFDFKGDYKGQVTFFAQEVYETLCRELAVRTKDTSVFRRNIITRGVDLNELVGYRFEVQGIVFEGSAECSPCYWMDQAFAPRAEELLQNRGGLRARILTGGTLRVGRKDAINTC